MNIILVLVDSLNRHHLSAYGPTSVSTPNLDRFADGAWRLDNHFVGSLACIPARREIFAGHKEMMWRPWGPLEPFDSRLPRLLEGGGYSTALVTDHYHYWEEAANGYMQSFQSAELIRGHEIDFWKQPISEDEPVPKWVRNIEKWRPPQMGRQYYANVKDFESEEDFFPAKVMTGATRWLDENARREPFFLQVESFDVHEPFHVPEPYASMYGDGSGGERFTLWPPYQDTEQLARFMSSTTPEEIEYIRSQYSGKLTMVDRWFGGLLDKLDELSLWENTMVVLTTDHGHDLGERGQFAKQYPDYDSHANIPLLVWHPEHPGDGRGASGLTQTVDVFSTTLEAAGLSQPENTHGRSFLPLLMGESGTDGREALLYGQFGQGACCTDGEWTLFKSPEHEGPLYYYSSLVFDPGPGVSLPGTVSSPAGQGHFIPGVELAQWQVPTRSRPRTWESFLFHRSEDPEQSRNLWDEQPDQRRRMLDLLRELLDQEGAPPEQYTRLGLGKYA
jgi:arylsulfatase A-like enzyme